MRRRLVVAALAACALGAPGPALAAGELSPRLEELSGPKLSDASAAEQAAAVSLTTGGPGSLSRIGEDLLAEVRVDRPAGAVATDLRRLGAEIVVVSRELSAVTVVASIDELGRIAGARGVESVEEVLRPVLGRVGQAGGQASPARGGAGSCATRTTGEGDAQLRADEVRSELGIEGAGIEVGVLSDSYDTAKHTSSGVSKIAADDIASGDLPGAGNPCGRTAPVDVLREYPAPLGNGTIPDRGQVDEGRAMLQIVHDLAPAARLSYATAALGEVAFANNIVLLADAGADVIVDDIGYLTEPIYQDGIIANAIAEVSDEGVTYYAAAGNGHQEIDGNPVGSWEADAYRPGPCPVIQDIPSGGDCMDFDPGAGVDTTQGLGVGSGSTRVAYHWAEPQFGVETNLDLYLVNGSGQIVARSVADETTSGGRPSNLVGFSLASDQNLDLIVRREDGAATPRLKWVLYGDQTAAPEYIGAGDSFGPTVNGHAASEATQAVGAVEYTSDDALEPFSSRGDSTRLFEPVSGTTPADPLASPETTTKPDIVATDGGRTTFFFGAQRRFYGTSAAAPHAAAVAALQLSADPGLTRGDLIANQRSTARPVGDFPPSAIGAGLIDAFESVSASVAPAAKPVITKKPKARTSSNRAVFAFRSASAASFVCSIDGKPAKPCSSPARYMVAKAKPRAKRHTFSVVALNGLREPSAAARARWTVQKRR